MTETKPHVSAAVSGCRQLISQIFSFNNKHSDSNDIYEQAQTIGIDLFFAEAKKEKFTHELIVMLYLVDDALVGAGLPELFFSYYQTEHAARVEEYEGLKFQLE